jgi:outer membrane receptor protein involved in Fe transport
MANALLNYRFIDGTLKNASVFVGVTHQGDVSGENVTGFTSLGAAELPGFYVPAFTIANAGAGYFWSRYRVNLNVDNALNTKAWWQASSRSSLAPYPGTTIRLTFVIHI